MANDQQPRGTPTITRRRLLGGAAAVGAGAIIAAGVARSQPPTSPLLTAEVGQPITRQEAPRQAPLGLSEETKLRHLLRRAGFGAGRTELDQYRSLGLQGAVDHLLEYEQVDNTALEERLERLGLDLSKAPDLRRWWLLRMIYTARPLEEKMTLFWHGLLTSSLNRSRPPEMLAQNRFLRAGALGRFPDILKGISADPAMMRWLDLASNRKGHPNENFARELLELFSLGVGHYTELDVRESARAFTGWIVRQRSFAYDRRQHDDGVKTVLGQTGKLDGDQVIDIIVAQPASARFIARKLFGFFGYPDPSEEVVRPLAEAYTAGDYSIKALVRAILTSDAFYAPEAYRAVVKSPVELVVGVGRMFGVETDGQGLPPATTAMGQMLFNPPNVAGWPGGAAWLNSSTWLARLNFVNRLIGVLPVVPRPGSRSRGGARGPFDVVALLEGATTPVDLVDRLLDLLLDGQVEPDQRQVLIDYVTPPDGTTLADADAAWYDERVRGTLYLIMAMPAYQLS